MGEDSGWKKMESEDGLRGMRKWIAKVGYQNIHRVCKNI